MLWQLVGARLFVEPTGSRISWVWPVQRKVPLCGTAAPVVPYLMHMYAALELTNYFLYICTWELRGLVLQVERSNVLQRILLVSTVTFCTYNNNNTVKCVRKVYLYCKLCKFIYSLDNSYYGQTFNTCFIHWI